ncbi:MAG: hypothetical protein AB1529_00715 [Candidatus Micrarchaeota archaeon]
MDENKVSEFIFANAPLIWPAAAIAASLLLAGGSTWLAAAAYLSLAALFIHGKWDARPLFSYGLLMLLASAITGFNGDTSDRIAENAYWLFVAGLARLAHGYISEKKAEQPKAPRRK